MLQGFPGAARLPVALGRTGASACDQRLRAGGARHLRWRRGEPSAHHDGAGARVGVVPLPAPGGPSWVSHFDFDTSVVLQPNRDYWLVVRAREHLQAGRARAHRTEGADFDQGIRSFWTRSTTFGPWVEQTGRALGFKLIGDTITAVGVGTWAPRAPHAATGGQPQPRARSGDAHLERRRGRGGPRGARRTRPSRGIARGRRQRRRAMDMEHGGRGRSAASQAVLLVRATDSQGQAAVARVAVIR